MDHFVFEFHSKQNPRNTLFLMPIPFPIFCFEFKSIPLGSAELSLDHPITVDSFLCLPKVKYSCSISVNLKSNIIHVYEIFIILKIKTDQDLRDVNIEPRRAMG